MIVGRKGERRKEIEREERRIFEKAFELLPTIYHLAIRGMAAHSWNMTRMLIHRSKAAINRAKALSKSITGIP